MSGRTRMADLAADRRFGDGQDPIVLRGLGEDGQEVIKIADRYSAFEAGRPEEGAWVIELDAYAVHRLVSALMDALDG